MMKIDKEMLLIIRKFLKQYGWTHSKHRY